VVLLAVLTLAKETRRQGKGGLPCLMILTLLFAPLASTPARGVHSLAVAFLGSMAMA
jgi:hypothetical protein